MTGIIKYVRLAAVAMGTSTSLVSSVQAQPCLPSPAMGREIRQFSRNLVGQVVPGKSSLNPAASTTVIQYNCTPTGGSNVVKSRQVNYGQLSLDFNVPTGCDELPKLQGRLVGDYFSLTRTQDPFSYTTPPLDNTRVGRHTANGNVIDMAGAVIGTFTMSGTIGTNTQRPAALFGVGPCYWCQHHEGLITIKLIKSTLFGTGARITATYSWDIDLTTSPDCKSNPCLMDQHINQGTIDGIIEATCGSIAM